MTINRARRQSLPLRHQESLLRQGLLPPRKSQNRHLPSPSPTVRCGPASLPAPAFRARVRPACGLSPASAGNKSVGVVEVCRSPFEKRKFIENAAKESATSDETGGGFM